jgi:hypothetical protein
MKPEPEQTPSTSVSRRTGLDRRWIACPNHQPERRSGVDRRQPQPQTLDTILEPATEPDGDGGRPTASSADAAPAERRVLRLPAIGSTPSREQGK